MVNSQYNDSYYFKQITEIKKWALNLGAFYLIFFTILDAIRYTDESLEHAMFVRLVYMLIPFWVLIFFFYQKDKFKLSKTQLDYLSFVVILLIGKGHAEIIELAANNSVFFPRIGLTIILIYAGILLVLPIKLSLISSLLIIITAANSYHNTGMSWVEILSLSSFYLAFSSCCVFMNYVCARVLITNFKLVNMIEEQANTDDLTGLFNRRYFFKQADHIFKQANREHKSMAIALIDLDDFKLVNDKLGHKYGDQVLIKFSAVFNNHCRRPFDMASRLGGDEFALMFYDCDQSYIDEVCLSIINEISVLSSTISKTLKKVNLGVSIGVAYNAKNEAFPVKTLIEMSDVAMYQVKGSGKNNYKISDKKDFLDGGNTSDFLAPA